MLRLVLLVLTIFQISSIKCEVANNVTDIANLYFQYVENATISHECKIQLNLLALGLGARKEWALKMLDATAKPQAGILLGNIMHVGNYDECLEVDEDLFGMKIQGKYCTAVLQAHPTYGEDFAKLLTSLNAGDKVVEGDILMELRKSYGVCVPKGCTIEDLRNLSNSIEEEFQSPAHFHFAEEYCDGGEKPPFSAAAIVAMSVRVEATRGCYNFSVPDSFFPLSPSSSSAAPSTTYFATSVSRRKVPTCSSPFRY
jgi:hypothetical protein